jgi:hypothetical protein
MTSWWCQTAAGIFQIFATIFTVFLQDQELRESASVNMEAPAALVGLDAGSIELCSREEAFRMVGEDGVSMRAAAKACGVPRVTFQRECAKGDVKSKRRMGREPALDKECYDALHEFIHARQQDGECDPFTDEELGAKIVSLAQERGVSFKDGFPSESYMRNVTAQLKQRGCVVRKGEGTCDRVKDVSGVI